MTRTGKILLSLAASITVFVVAAVTFIQTGFFQACSNTVFSTSKNISNEYTAVLFERSCGATTGFSTQVSIIKSHQHLLNEGGNIYIADGHPNNSSLVWLSANTLLIGGTDSSAYKRLQSFNGIKIQYE